MCDQLVVKVSEAVAILAISERSIRRMIGDGRLKTVPGLSETRITKASIRALVDGTDPAPTEAQ